MINSYRRSIIVVPGTDTSVLSVSHWYVGLVQVSKYHRPWVSDTCLFTHPRTQHVTNFVILCCHWVDCHPLGIYNLGCHPFHLCYASTLRPLACHRCLVAVSVSNAELISICRLCGHHGWSSPSCQAIISSWGGPRQLLPILLAEVHFWCLVGHG